MKLSDREERFIQKLRRYPQTYSMHLSAAMVLMAGGVGTMWRAAAHGSPTDIWIGCLLMVMGCFWWERLRHNRACLTVIGKLLVEIEYSRSSRQAQEIREPAMTEAESNT